jgi:4-hydroxy-2-oxoheptanedioate aldolase
VSGDPTRPALAARVASGDPLTALFAKMPCAAQVEIAGHVGFDMVMLDTEHGPGGGYALEEHLRAADAAGLPALVRVNDATEVLAALDAGASGVVIPHVLDEAAAEAAVAAAHYPPRGRRGLARSTRAGRYGAVPLDEHLRRASAETCVVIQIEDAQAVEAADAILAVPGVTAVLIGEADLAMSLGHPPAAEIERVIAAARRARVPVMTVAASERAALADRARGVQAIAFVSTTLIAAAFREAAAGARPVRSGREPLVLLPGMLGDASLWDEVAPALADVAAVRFARIDFDDSIPAMAETVLAAAPERFALAGHSLGAIVALEVVRQTPHRVTRLALLNASARPADDAQLTAWAAMREGDFTRVAREFAHANARNGSDAAADARARAVKRIEAMARAVGPRGHARQLSAQATRPDSRPSLNAIGVPTLIVSGSDDAICPPPLQEELAAAIPGARRVVIEGAGHMAALDQAAAVAAHLKTWLETE